MCTLSVCPSPAWPITLSLLLTQGTNTDIDRSEPQGCICQLYSSIQLTAVENCTECKVLALSCQSYMGIYHSLGGNWKLFRLWEFACVSEPINCSLKSVWIKIRIFENVVMCSRKESNLGVSLGQYQICVSQVLHLLP